ncbi:MAG: sugar kinase [bacterium]|nr:sugar kinase [bacterium]
MSLLVVGSVALDTIETPFGKTQEALGGSAIYFSCAASYFTDVSLVAVVGEDFPQEHIDLLERRGIDTSGLVKTSGHTFRWVGRYGFDLNEAETINTYLNVFEQFRPTLTERHREKEFIFLANIDPDLQKSVLHQIERPRFAASDTMNFWIERKNDSLKSLLKSIDVLVINEAEARQLAGEANIFRAARAILSFGPKSLIIKRGEYGSLTFHNHSVFVAPAYPLETVFDPTGAGDSFAGGLMGFLAKTRNFDTENIKRAVIFGSVMASFAVETFSLERLANLDEGEIFQRYRKLREITNFEDFED